MTRFFITISIAAIVIAGATWLGSYLQWFPQMPSFYLETTAFLAISIGVAYKYLYRVDKNSFVQLYLLTMVFKLLLYGGFNLAIILLDKPGAPENVVFFLISYFVFTVLEVVFLFRKVNL